MASELIVASQENNTGFTVDNLMKMSAAIKKKSTLLRCINMGTTDCAGRSIIRVFLSIFLLDFSLGRLELLSLFCPKKSCLFNKVVLSNWLEGEQSKFIKSRIRISLPVWQEWYLAKGNRSEPVLCSLVWVMSWLTDTHSQLTIMLYNCSLNTIAEHASDGIQVLWQKTVKTAVVSSMPLIVRRQSSNSPVWVPLSAWRKWLLQAKGKVRLFFGKTKSHFFWNRGKARQRTVSHPTHPEIQDQEWARSREMEVHFSSWFVEVITTNFHNPSHLPNPLVSFLEVCDGIFPTCFLQVVTPQRQQQRRREIKT